MSPTFQKVAVVTPFQAIHDSSSHLLVKQLKRVTPLQTFDGLLMQEGDFLFFFLSPNDPNCVFGSFLSPLLSDGRLGGFGLHCDP